MRAPATASARSSESVAAKADRYFADQCRRLGPVEPNDRLQPARRASPSRSRLDREFRRLAAT